MKVQVYELQQLSAFLDDIEAINTSTVEPRNSKLSVTLCREILYTLNTKIKKKIRDAHSSPEIKFNLKYPDAIALLLMYTAIGCESEFVQRIAGEIDKRV